MYDTCTTECTSAAARGGQRLPVLSRPADGGARGRVPPRTSGRTFRIGTERSAPSSTRSAQPGLAGAVPHVGQQPRRPPGGAAQLCVVPFEHLHTHTHQLVSTRLRVRSCQLPQVASGIDTGGYVPPLKADGKPIERSGFMVGCDTDLDCYSRCGEHPIHGHAYVCSLAGLLHARGLRCRRGRAAAGRRRGAGLRARRTRASRARRSTPRST